METLASSFSRVDRLEGAEVLLGGGDGLLALADLLAEDVDGGHGAFLVELADDADGVVQSLARDVAGSHPADDRLRHQGQGGDQHAVEHTHLAPLLG